MLVGCGSRNQVEVFTVQARYFHGTLPVSLRDVGDLNLRCVASRALTRGRRARARLPALVRRMAAVNRAPAWHLPGWCSAGKR
jgi:hypothetical protein